MSEDINTKEERKESGFFQMLTRDNAQIKKDRAKRLEQITESTMNNIISDIENEILQLEDELASQTDVSTSNDANTINRIQDWDAKRFVKKRVDLKVKIKNLRINLEAAQEVKAELF